MVEDLVVNTLSPHCFLYSHHLNHVRRNTNTVITESEVFEIIKDFEKKCFKEACIDIELKNGYKKDEVKIIFSSILAVKIDGKKVSSLFGKI